MIEPLESRIAPASVFTFTDVDGDAVTIKTSKGTDAQLAAIVTLAPGGLGQQLQRIDFSADGAAFAGTNLTVTAKRTAAGGDGSVNVGYIDATMADGGTRVDLGIVSIRGDLGQIAAGDGNAATQGVEALAAQSVGRLGLSTQALGGTLDSAINGGLGNLAVSGDFAEASLVVNGSIGSVAISGSVLGGAADDSGLLRATQAIGPVKIGGDLRGGDGLRSGRIEAGTTLASVTIGGSVVGGAGGSDLTDSSGTIFAVGNLGAVKITVDLRGGAGDSSGSIRSDQADLGRVAIGGSIFGAGPYSATVSSRGGIAEVKVGGGVFAGVAGSAAITTDNIVGGLFGNIGKVTVGGSVVGGPNGASGRISADGNIGSVKIGGDLRGVDGGGNSDAEVAAGGTIGSITLGGSLIGVGDVSGNISASNGGLGAVKIGGDIRGGGNNSGNISGASLGSLFVGGSIIGGAVSSASLVNSAAVLIAGDIGSVKILGDLRGGDIGGTATTSTRSGVIRSSAGSIGSISIGGSIVAGSELAGALVDSGAIRAAQSLGTLTVGGSLIGNDTHSVFIIAAGQETPSAKSDVAIKSVTVRGRVEFTSILAGFDIAGTPAGVNGDAQIGKIAVGGDWIASRVAAGTDDGADNIAGTGDDTLLGAGAPGIISRIGSIVIKGAAYGTVGGADAFRFIAEKVGTLRIGSTTFPLTGGADDLAIGPTGDLRLFDNA